MDFIFVKDKGIYKKIYVKDIMYLEAQKDYVAIYALGKRHMAHSTMADIEAKMPADRFVRIHRSYIVQMQFVDSVELTSGNLLIGEKRLSIGDAYKSGLKSKMNLVC